MATKKNTKNTKAHIDFTIEKHIGVIRTAPSGWTRELNVVKWADRDPVFDIRDWSPEHDKMGRGLSFTGAELKALYDIITEANEKLKAQAKATKPKTTKTTKTTKPKANAAK